MISVSSCGKRTLSSLSNKHLSFHHADEEPFSCNNLSYTEIQFLKSFLNRKRILNIPACLSLSAFLHISILAEWKGTYLSWGEATSTTFLKYWRPVSNAFTHLSQRCTAMKYIQCQQDYFMFKHLWNSTVQNTWKLKHASQA